MEQLTCTICNKPNHHLAVICTGCGGFLQRRIENLDLFTTAWKLVEHPGKAFHEIAVSNHKNYRLFLSSLCGIGLVFTIFWWIKAGDRADSLLQLLAAGFVAGPVFGIVTVLFCGLMIAAISTVFRLQIGFRNATAVLSYATIPVAISVITLLPIELMSFGQFFFGTNPSPYLLKPTSYITLLVFDGFLGLWSLILVVTGMRTLLAGRTLKAVILTAVVLGVYGAIVSGGIQLILRGNF